MSELKPCPFCGSNKIITRKTRMWHRVVCEACGTVSGYWFNKEQAITAWNERAERTCKECAFDGLYANNCVFCNRHPKLSNQFIAKVVE